MKRSLFNSFQFRLALFTVLAVVLTGLAVLLYFGFDSANRIRREREQDLAQAALALADNVSGWEERAILALDNMSRQPAIISMQTEQQEPVVIEYTNVYQNIYLASTTDLNGINVARSDGNEPKEYGDRPWFKGAAAGNDLTRQTLIGRTSGEPALCHSMPIRDGQQQISGVAMACTDLTELTATVGATRLGDTGFAFLVNEHGQVLAHPQFAAAGELIDLSDFAPVKALLAGQEGLVTFSDETGVEWLAQVVSLDNGWGVVAQQTSAEVLSPVRTAVLISSLVVVLIVVLGSAAVWFAARRMADPLTGLSQTAAAFAEGDYDRRVAVESGDELGLLAGTFNTMADQLQATLESITARSRRLERMVELNEALSAVLDANQLLAEAANQLEARLGFRHVLLYLRAEDDQSLVLAEATGQAGARLKAETYTIPPDMADNPVARAAQTDQVVLVSNVEQAADWSPTPYLNETGTEVAVPIRLADRVVAVLNVQADQPGSLDDEVSLLRSVASQMATSMRNADLFAEVEKALDEARLVQEQYVQQAWDKDRVAARASKHLYVQPAAPDLSAAKRADARRKALREQRPALVAGDASGAEGQSIVAPVVLGTRTIGALQLHQIEANGGTQTWSDEDLAMIEAVLDQVAQTAENLRLFDETRERATATQALYEANAQLSAAQSFDDIIDVLREHTIAGRGSQTVSIGFFSQPWTDTQQPDSIEILARWATIPSEVLISNYAIADFPFLGTLVRADRSAFVEDVFNDPHLDDNARALFYDRYGAQSMIFVPMVVGRDWIAFVSVGYPERTAFSDDDKRRLEALVGQAAVVVQSLNRLAETQARASREQAIREITDKLRAAPNMGRLLDIATQEISQHMAATHAKLALGRDAQQAATNGNESNGTAKGE